MLTIHVNVDNQDQPLNTSGVDWVELNQNSDRVTFCTGSDVYKDGESIPSQFEFQQAGILISEVSDVEVAKCFLEDASSGTLKEIELYADNARYVYAFEFDDSTASEPTLELWDDATFSTRDLNSLGAGTAANSWWYGVVTTDGLPGASWTGTKLAGNADNHFLYLNNENGALSAAKTLYANLKVVIPAGTTVSGIEQPRFVVRFTES